LAGAIFFEQWTDALILPIYRDSLGYAAFSALGQVYQVVILDKILSASLIDWRLMA
jgi:hypothetical protein